MVLGAAPNGAKGGIEEQTGKLFEVCRLRDVVSQATPAPFPAALGVHSQTG
jgi:hypothetical protein